MIYNLQSLKAYTNVIKNNFLNLMKLKVYPRAAHYILTWKCNLKCKDCSAWSRVNGNELKKEEVIALLKKVKFLDIIKLTGGEPFIRNDIVDIIAAVKEIINPYIMQVTTNGTYTHRILECIKKTHFPGLQLRISLDGIGKVHDRIRGVEGCYNKTKETLLSLIDLKKKKS